MREIRISSRKNIFLGVAICSITFWSQAVMAEPEPKATEGLRPEVVSDKQDVTAEEASPTKEEKKAGQFIVDAAMDTTYNTNVFYYSRDEIDSFDAGADTNDRFKNIKSIDDFIFSPTVDLGYKDLLFGHTFKTGIVLAPHFYAYNKSKDYADYGYYARQYLNKGEFVEFNYGRTPDYMEGNFFDRDDSVYKEASYSEDRFNLGYNRPLTSTLSVMGQYFYTLNNYNSNFNEYDQKANAVRLALRNAFTEKLTGRVFGEYSREDAKGNLNETVRTEADPSRDIWKINLRGTYDFTNKLQAYLQYGIWFIDYTTEHPVAVDPYHAERDDVFQSIGCHLSYKLTKSLELYLSYQFSIKDAALATDDLSVLDAAILGYERHQVSSGVKVLF